VVGLPLRSRSADIIEGRGCATVVTMEERAYMEQALDSVRLFKRGLQNSKAAAKVKPVKFDVYFHIIAANETYEGGWIPNYQIKAQVERLNTDFNTTGISFNYRNTSRILNADWFENVFPGSPQEQELKRAYRQGDSNTLNIYTAGFNRTNPSLGYGSMPSKYFKDPISDGVIVRYSTFPGGERKNYNLGRTTVHEVGHWFGLYHTFEGDGCDGVGDNVADTAPEASGAEGCPVGRNTCPGGPPDPIHNYMDYSFDSCMREFTKGQAVRMHEAIRAFRTPRNATTLASSSSSSSTPSATPTKGSSGKSPAKGTVSPVVSPPKSGTEAGAKKPVLEETYTPTTPKATPAALRKHSAGSVMPTASAPTPVSDDAAYEEGPES